MPWPKGKPKHQNSGRKKGVQNRVTGLLKDAILRAAQIAGGDGEDGLLNYLVRQANENPTSYMTLLGKVLPTQLAAEPDEDGGQVLVFINRYAADGTVTVRDVNGNSIDDPTLLDDADYKRLPKPR
jgi:hypothetical protein